MSSKGVSKMVLAIFGAGGNGRDIEEYIAAENRITHKWEHILFVDDVVTEQEVLGVPRYSFATFCERYTSESNVEFLISIGDPDGREKVYQMIYAAGYHFGTFISKDSYVPPSCKIGAGTIIISSRIGSLAVIGKNTMLGGQVAVGHDSVVGDHCVLVMQVFVGGHSILGNNLFIGAHAAMKDTISVGTHSVIAMGAVVLENVPENTVVLGNPAKFLPRRNGAPLFG